MLISERQVMKLIAVAHAHLANLYTINAPMPYIDDVEELLNDICDSQPDKTFDVTDKTTAADLQTKVCYRCGWGVYTNE